MQIPRISPATYRRVTLFALLALGAIVVTGAAVRLTGSGLGCPEWPNCDPGHLTPHGTTGGHGAVEFLNRVFTGLISATVILAVLGSRIREPRRRDLTWLSLGLVLGVVAQIVLGAVVVIVDLSPPWVMAHFVASMFLVADAVVLHERAGEPDGRRVPIVSSRVRHLGAIVPVLAGMVIVAGTVVTGAGPHGGDEKVARLDVPVSDVARIHGILVNVLIVSVLVSLWLLGKEGAPQRARRRADVLIAVLVAQAFVGYVQYLSGVPEVLVAVHIVGVVAVWIATIRYTLGLRQVLNYVDDADARADGGPGTDRRGEGRAGSPVGGDRLERSDQPDGLRDVRLPEAVRLQPREGDQAHA